MNLKGTPKKVPFFYILIPSQVRGYKKQKTVVCSTINLA